MEKFNFGTLVYLTWQVWSLELILEIWQEIPLTFKQVYKITQLVLIIYKPNEYFVFTKLTHLFSLAHVETNPPIAQ